VRLSVVIPAHNEADSIEATVRATAARLEEERIDYELLVVDDASDDGTLERIAALTLENPRIRGITSHLPRGFGYCVRAGLDEFDGDVAAIMMADGSDAPADLVTYHRLIESGYDCAFGSRFVRGAHVSDYPRFKLALNRAANLFVRLLFRHGYNDTTNAFKAYRREVIETAQPLLSNHFNLTVELPLKAVVRGHSYAICPISWTNRMTGTSKLNLQEMGSRYLFIVLYVWLELHLSKGDYRLPGAPRRPVRAPSPVERSPAAKTREEA